MKKTKKSIAIVLALIMILSMLIGCGSNGNETGNKNGDKKDADSSSNQDSSGAPDNEDRVLNIATSGDTGTLYPLAASGGFVSLEYAFYEPLWTVTKDNEMIFKLATSYEQVDEKGLEWTLKIREGVQFSNGNPLTADDVYFSMDICKDDPRFYLNVGYVDFEKTAVIDEYTIDVWYKEPTYTQISSFSQLMVMDKESFDMESLSTNPIGTGPYIVTDYVVNSHVSCVANENYWGGAPAVKAIEFKVINETSQIVNALEVGDVDIVSGIPVDEIEYIQGLGYETSTIYGGYANTALYSFAGALSSKEARYAVSMAMDRESMSYIMYKGYSTVPKYPTSEHCIDYQDRFANLHETYSTGYNVEAAKKYAEEAGLVGKTLKIITNGAEAYNDVAAVIKENLAAIGVNSEIASYDSATYFSIVMDETNFDIALFYLSAPSMLACDIMCSYLDFIPLGWHDEAREEYRTLCGQVLTTMDDEARGDLTYELIQRFVEYTPWYSICEAITVSAITKDIGGAQYYLAGNLFYQDLYWK